MSQAWRFILSIGLAASIASTALAQTKRIAELTAAATPLAAGTLFEASVPAGGGSYVSRSARLDDMSFTLGSTEIALSETATSVAGLTLGSGSVWNGSLIAGQYGGTGVANTGKTITLGGSLTTAGAFDTTLTVTAATDATLPAGTHTLAGLDVVQTWSANQQFNSGNFLLKGATSGTLTVQPAAVAGTNTLTLPAGTTDFSATGGAGQVVKQTSAGGAFTVATVDAAELAGLGTGVATWLATPSSANLRAALTDESGSGAAYFQGGNLGTPSAGVLTNATGLPISTGVSGLGTGVAALLAGNATGSGSPVGGTGPTIDAPTLSGTVAGTYTLGGTPTLGAAMTLPGGGQISSGGSIGIGVAPAFPLNVAGSGAIASIFDNQALAVGVGGQVNFAALNNAAAQTAYATINSYAESGTAGAETGKLLIQTITIGSTAVAAQFRNSRLMLGNVSSSLNPQATLHIGSTAATARSYNSFPDSSNGEWAYLGDWGKTANVATYGSDQNGTGTARDVQLMAGGVGVVRINNGGFAGFGSTSPGARIHIDNNLSSPAWTHTGIALRVSSPTYTDTTSSGTVGEMAIVSFLQPTVAASSVTTYTNATMLRLAAPLAGTNVTFTNAYALRVVTGITRLDGAIWAGATPGVSCSGSPTAGFTTVNGIVTAC